MKILKNILKHKKIIKKHILKLKNIQIDKKVCIYFKIFSYTIIKNIQFLTHFLNKNLKYKKSVKNTKNRLKSYGIQGRIFYKN